MRALAVQHGLFGLVPALAVVLAVRYVAVHGALAVDFDRQYWVAGDRTLHGLNPYDPAWQRLTAGIGFPYAALDALLFVPFALLPRGVADVVFTGIDLGAMVLAVRLLGVRDWRVYGVVLLWAPVFTAWQSGNVTALLVLGVAVVWRERGRAAVCGGLIALLITVKLFVWPLALWLLVTRRYVHLAWVLGVGLALNLGSWAVVGFDQFDAYRSLLKVVTRLNETRVYNVTALSLHHGAGHVSAYALGLTVTAVVMVACLVAGRRGRDRNAFLLALAVALIAAPVIWSHYFALLLVPLALSRPRLHALWLLPWVLVVCPVTDPADWQIALMLGVAAVVIVSSLARDRNPGLAYAAADAPA